ncbi:hypothetical protein AAHA92_33241 [Salvia divinorum]|uniref:Thaumatin-like protein n=1 Tax=Salvia divinorum TaxID=28513 RepID=A0ABD1FNC2_SALDI
MRFTSPSFFSSCPKFGYNLHPRKPVRYCDYTVWPGILSNTGSSGLGTTGFQLIPHATQSFEAPSGWSGRFWGRTGCSFDPISGQGSCATGDCGSNQIECNSAGAIPPATLAEFTIGSGAQDFYDVSLVDGYNLPMIVEPVGGSGACGLTRCVRDLNRVCPNELRPGDGQACKSACEAFGKYCCSGTYGSPATCRPSVYSEMFKRRARDRIATHTMMLLVLLRVVLQIIRSHSALLGQVRNLQWTLPECQVGRLRQQMLRLSFMVAEFFGRRLIRCPHAISYHYLCTHNFYVTLISSFLDNHQLGRVVKVLFSEKCE